MASIASEETGVTIRVRSVEPVTIQHAGSIGDFARRLGDALGLEARWDGREYLISDAKQIRVARAGLIPSEEVVAAGQALGAIAVPVGDAVVLQGGSETITNFWQQLSTVADEWMVSIEFQRAASEASRSTGVSTSAGVDVRLNLRDGDSNIDLGADATLSGQWRRSSAAGSSMRTLELVVLEGSKGTISEETQVPVLRRAVSPEGTVTVTGYDLINAGLRATVAIQRVEDCIRTDVVLSVGAIGDRSSEVPTVDRRELTSSLILCPEQRRHIGRLRVLDQSIVRDGLIEPIASRTLAERSSDVDVYVSAVRVGSAATRTPASESQAGPTGTASTP